MTAEIKQKWIEALRSGNYKQGTGYLKATDGTWCCLGVLCDVLGRDVPAGDRVSPILMSADPVYTACYTAIDEVLEGRPNSWFFIRLNDTENKSFKQIADYIEKIL